MCRRASNNEEEPKNNKMISIEDLIGVPISDGSPGDVILLNHDFCSVLFSLMIECDEGEPD